MLSWLRLLVVFAAGLSSLGVVHDAPAGEAGDGANARIQKVERGLLPPVLIQGEKLPAMSLHDRMARWKVPGVSIAVIDGGTVAWARAYGVVAAGTGDSVTTETLFQAGSVSKPIAAMTALHLVEEGRLALDADVNQYLRSWKIPASDSAGEVPVTLRMLLTHSAGLTVHGFPGYAPADSIPTLLQILDGVRPANTPPIRVDLRPGATFRYSGGGFCVVQQLLADVTSEPYAQIVERLVLRPLGMAHSTFEQPAAPVAGVQRAAGHAQDSATIPGRWHRYPELAAAGLWTTPGDLARLVVEIQASWRGAGRRVLSPSMTRAMLSPQITATQGIGWRLGGHGKAARFEHSGDTDGFACAVAGDLERGRGAVVMTNGARGGDLVQEILRGIAKEYGWEDYLPAAKRVVSVPQALPKLAGRYALDVAPNIFVDIAASHDSLFVTVVQPSGTERARLLAESPTRFFDQESGLEMTFVLPEDGRARYVTIHLGDEEYRASLVP
jgi:CubicO group peptidase (beta-lactamase class C family)